jgi:hypothetical protein
LDGLVARINTCGGNEARGGLLVVGLGVFPSFITAIFINGVLRRFITHMCFNPCKMMG